MRQIAILLSFECIKFNPEAIGKMCIGRINLGKKAAFLDEAGLFPFGKPLARLRPARLGWRREDLFDEPEI